MPHYPLCLAFIGAFLITLGDTQRHEEDLKSLIRDTNVNHFAPRPLPSIGSASNDDDDFEVELVYTKNGGLVLDEESSPITSAEGGSFKPVRRVWGVPDTETHVGRIFSYPIPDDAFEGDVKGYRFSDLPSWLSFSSRRKVLEGVPAPSDVGPHYITVQAEGTDGVGAKDAFAIQVKGIPASSLLKESRCSPKQDVTLMSVILARPFKAIQPRDKIQLIQTASRIFVAKANKISLIPSPTNVDPLTDESAIRAGVGSSVAEASSSSPEEQTLLQFSVGCNGEIHKEDREAVNKVETASLSGKLENALGIPVTGWIVIQVNPSTKKVKREADYSGDYGNNDYDYDDYEEDYYHLNNVGPLDRIAPTHATPVFPESRATVYHGEVPVSPVFKVVPISTPVYIPVKPTRVVVEASPTLVYKTDYPFGGVDTHLDSSLLTHPTTSADYTTPLKSTTSLLSKPSKASSPLDVTSVPEASETTEYGVKYFQPRIENRIPKIDWNVGNVYRMRIPEDMFIDVEDGRTRNLTLVLKDENRHSFSNDSWIQFDPIKQEVYALPQEKHIGRYDFKLEAIDKDRMTAFDHLDIRVAQDSRARNFHHQFTAVLKIEKKYEYDFAFSLDWQVKAVEKIAALFNDSISNINVRNITSNPVQIMWTNVSLVDSSSTMCPTEELKELARVMLTGHGSEPSKLARQVFAPEFQLKKIHSHFYHPCEPHFHHHGRHHPSHPETNILHPLTTSEGAAAGGASSSLEEENKAPVVRNHIDKLEATVGRLFRYQVPDDTCFDKEDHDSRNLKMQILLIDSTPPSKDSWLQFDSANQEFYGLPLKEDWGSKEYILKCVGKGPKPGNDAFIVKVEDDKNASSPKPALFTMTVNASYDEFMSSAFDKARLLDNLGKALGDSGPENIVVRSLSEGSVKVEWYNSSLRNDPCPTEEIQRLRQMMTDGNGSALQSFKNAFLPHFQVTGANQVIPSGSCLAGDTPTHVDEALLPSSDEKGSGGVSTPRDEDYLLTFVVPAVIIAAMLLLAALIACCLYRRRRYGKMSMAGDRTFVSKGIPIIFAEELDDHRPDNAKSPVIMKEEKPPLPPPEYQRNSPPRNERQQQQRPQSGDANSSEDAPYHRPPPFTASNGGSRNQRPNLPPAYRKPPTYVPP